LFMSSSLSLNIKSALIQRKLNRKWSLVGSRLHQLQLQNTTLTSNTIILSRQRQISSATTFSTTSSLPNNTKDGSEITSSTINEIDVFHSKIENEEKSGAWKQLIKEYYRLPSKHSLIANQEVFFNLRKPSPLLMIGFPISEIATTTMRSIPLNYLFRQTIIQNSSIGVTAPVMELSPRQFTTSIIRTATTRSKKGIKMNPRTKSKQLSQSSSKWLHRHVNDPYVKRAKNEKVPSRSIYKLEELERLIKQKQKVNKKPSK